MSNRIIVSRRPIRSLYEVGVVVAAFVIGGTWAGVFAILMAFDIRPK